MVNALLGFVFIYCLFYGRLFGPVLILASAGIAVFFFVNGRHKHTGFIPIDIVAQFSRLKTVDPTLKISTLLVLMVLSVASGNPFTGLFLTVVMLALTVFVGGIKLHEYVQIIALPVGFLLVSGLALLFEVDLAPAGVINFDVLNIWFCVSAEAQAQAMLVIARAMGALSCLLAIGMSTPMPDVINVLRRMRCPKLIIDLSYLIYRYVFVLLGLHHEMHDAAKSRLGMKDYKTSLRTTAHIYSNLLARSHQMASINFDAMESRCFDSGIRFLERRSKADPPQVCMGLGLVAITLALSVLPL